MNSEHIMILSRLATGSIAAFLSILLWSKTRDTAWMFVIIGVIVICGETIFQTLKAFGIVRADLLAFSGVSVFELVLTNLPIIFFAVAFLIMFFRRALR
ncbi:MAG: hypothetical protein FWG35_02205 [Spirochaetaceae bacterium]|nr:hypothetical protein [Spirochaetaceae bacterium]